jgi:DNA-binding Lrp family transcriptional regulator
VRGVAQLHRDGEIEAGGAAAENRDFHGAFLTPAIRIAPGPGYFKHEISRLKDFFEEAHQGICQPDRHRSGVDTNDRGREVISNVVRYRRDPMRAVFVQLQCQPGKTYEVADTLFEREIVSELYSTSGEYDLLMKIYIEEEDDIGKFINDNVANVPGIVRSLTTLTFKAF